MYCLASGGVFRGHHGYVSNEQFDRPARSNIVARMIDAGTDRVTTRLPEGYRARPFEDRDREPMIAERNTWFGPMKQADAEDWRMWERMAPDESMYRITVEDDAGRVVGLANISAGGITPHPDGAQSAGVSVARGDRGKGIGSALLEAIEEEARSREAPRLLAGASAAHPDALAWAAKRGFREIGRRIESYVELGTFDPSPFAARLDEVRRSGITLRTIAEALEGRDRSGRDGFARALYEAESPMWEDIPYATPTPHWSYDRFQQLMFESGQLLEDVSIVAYDGERIVGLTTTVKRQAQDGSTWLTGTAREYRSRGLATAMKVAALTRAKAKGLRALLTTNDEPNKAMRGINAKLGYQMLPAHVQLEKILSRS
jgi:GNAT superfamily N-acetyltransferase